MLSKKVKSRFFLFFIITISLGLLIVFIFKSLEKNIVYFLSPTEIYKDTDISLDNKIRIGGLVKVNSITKDGNTINFVITDLKNEIVVSYTGIIPNLFSEGKGVVAEGKLKDKKYFIADTILAKHDENYMPPEVKKALEKTDY